jgi:HAMP domain-containing protein
MPGLWGDDEPGLGMRPANAARRRAESPAEGLARARHELATGDPAERERGLARLALVLRQDPTTAADVLAAVSPLREATAQLVRGDACRLLGRHLEAEAAFAAAAQALDESRHRPRSRSS